MSLIILPFVVLSLIVTGGWDEFVPIGLRFIAFLIWIFVLGEIHTATAHWRVKR